MAVVEGFIGGMITHNSNVALTTNSHTVNRLLMRVSIVCRIVPSPDWFIGVDSFDLCPGNKWVDLITLDLEPIDGGTDNGYTFTSPKWATDPRSRISPIRSHYPKHPASSFFYPELEKLPRLASVTFHKLKEFFLIKEVNMDLKGESLKLDRSMDNYTRATVISPLELTRFAVKQGNKFQKDKKKTMYSTEISAFRSKTEATTKSKVRSSNKHHYRSKSCRVSEWSEWGNCSKQCGFGEQKYHVNRSIDHNEDLKRHLILQISTSYPCEDFLSISRCKGDNLSAKALVPSPFIPAVAPLTPTLHLSQVCNVYLSWGAATPENSTERLRRETNLKSERNISAHGSAHFSPTPLVLGDNRRARLFPTTALYLFTIWSAINRLVTMTLRVCLCHDRPTLLFIQIVCSPHVRGEPNTIDTVHRSFIPIER
ncbi:spondin-2 [Trichonephila clavipes]|nr:spondin-2 [Trichonephila clavipes]